MHVPFTGGSAAFERHKRELVHLLIGELDPCLIDDGAPVVDARDDALCVRSRHDRRLSGREGPYADNRGTGFRVLDRRTRAQA